MCVSFQLHDQRLYVVSLKLALVGVFIPLELAATTNYPPLPQPKLIVNRTSAPWSALRLPAPSCVWVFPKPELLWLTPPKTHF